MAQSDNKKFYWLKLHKDFFKRHDIRIIEQSPNGKDYILFYLKLLCESTSHQGELRFSDTIPYSEHMLATITNTNIDVVKSAIKLFTDLDMLEIMNDSTIYMTETQKMLGKGEADVEQQRKNNAERQRRHREKVKAIENASSNDKNNVTVTLHSNVEIEKEIELDKEKDKEYKETFVSLISNYTLNDNLVEALNDYIEMRKKQKGFTIKALKLNLNKLDKLAGNDYEKIDIVNQSIERSWKSFFPIKNDNDKQNKKGVHTLSNGLETTNEFFAYADSMGANNEN